ncbi:MAG: hypothetical protein MRY32_05785 [Rickettsiales bacterium]|nr:hypothetical protein [Rickettsiales bacterium]
MKQDAVPYIWLLLLVAAQLTVSLILNDGVFYYALDDAYIHLELANQILSGNYGLQDGELSSPSSSILWPIILAPFAVLPFFTLVPFIINLLAALASVALLQSFFQQHFDEIIRTHKAAYRVALCSMIVGLNLGGLCLIGMEHGLQILCATFLITSILHYQMAGDFSRWNWFVILVAPLIRYECLALSGVALVWFMLNTRFWWCVFAGGVIMTFLILFSLFLHWIGLPTMPLSVLVKQASVSMIPGGSITYNLMQPAAWVMLGGIGLLYYKARGNPVFTFKALYIGGILIMVSHLLFGMVGVRYDAYVWGFVLPLLLFSYRSEIRAFLANSKPILIYARIVVALAGLMAPYSLYSMYEAPVATHNIASMHGNMHRFATEFWKQPIAVNDIGRISYDNPHYVLDMVGLSNFKAYQLGSAHMANPNRAWMDLLATQHNVQAAMLFESWFKPHLPADWVKVGELKLDCCNVALPQEILSFYATSALSADALRAALTAFQAAIGDGASIEIK